MEGPIYYLSRSDVEGVFELLSGVVTVQTYTLLVQLIALGVALVLVFVVSLRRL